jgi:hypothetical protein
MAVFAGVLISLYMFIEPYGIEYVTAMWTPCAAMGYYHVLVHDLVRNRLTAFETVHAGNGDKSTDFFRLLSWCLLSCYKYDLAYRNMII